MILVVDDALLLRVLAGLAEGEVGEAARRSDVFTTGSWYFRLSRVVHSRHMTGALSGPFARFSAERRSRVVAALDQLPGEIGLLSLRDLVPVMRRLEAGRNLNLLSAEALAAAKVLDAAIRVSTHSPMLTEVGGRLGLDVGVLSID